MNFFFRIECHDKTPFLRQKSMLPLLGGILIVVVCCFLLPFLLWGAYVIGVFILSILCAITWFIANNLWLLCLIGGILYFLSLCLDPHMKRYKK